MMASRRALLILRSPPTGPRIARPEDRLRGRLEGRTAPITDRIAKAIDPAADLLRAGLQRRTVDDQPRADLGDALDLDQAVGLQCGAGLDEIDDMTAETEMGGELDRAVELDAFGLNTAGGEMAAGNLRIFGRYPDVAPACDILTCGPVGGSRDRDMAVPDIEVERRVNLGIIELHQYVIAGNAELSRAEGDKGGHVEAADADQIEAAFAGGEAELTRRRIVEGALR